MQFTSQTTSDAVSTRLFTLDGITGALWTPARATSTALVLLAHGGGQHRTAEAMVGRARRYVTAHDFAVAAIDAPGHGDRPRAERDAMTATWERIRERAAAGEALGPLIAQGNADLAARAVPDWRATLDALGALGVVDPGGPVGLLGMSMGAAIGVPLLAAEPRITAAVLGLAGSPALAGTATRITVPVEFLLQWNDEVVPRQDALAMFDAFASTEKTLHANPGGHRDVPVFERDSSERFFVRHLLGTGAVVTGSS